MDRKTVCFKVCGMTWCHENISTKNHWTSFCTPVTSYPPTQMFLGLITQSIAREKPKEWLLWRLVTFKTSNSLFFRVVKRNWRLLYTIFKITAPLIRSWYIIRDSGADSLGGGNAKLRKKQCDQKFCKLLNLPVLSSSRPTICSWVPGVGYSNSSVRKFRTTRKELSGFGDCFHSCFELLKTSMNAPYTYSCNLWKLQIYLP